MHFIQFIHDVHCSNFALLHIYCVPTKYRGQLKYVSIDANDSNVLLTLAAADHEVYRAATEI